MAEKLTPKEIGEKGRALYERHKKELEESHPAEYVVFNVATAEYIILSQDPGSDRKTLEQVLSRWGEHIPKFTRKIGPVTSVDSFYHSSIRRRLKRRSA